MSKRLTIVVVAIVFAMGLVMGESTAQAEQPTVCKRSTQPLTGSVSISKPRSVEGSKYSWWSSVRYRSFVGSEQHERYGHERYVPDRDWVDINPLMIERFARIG